MIKPHAPVCYFAQHHDHFEGGKDFRATVVILSSPFFSVFIRNTFLDIWRRRAGFVDRYSWIELDASSSKTLSVIAEFFAAHFIFCYQLLSSYISWFEPVCTQKLCNNIFHCPVAYKMYSVHHSVSCD